MVDEAEEIEQEAYIITKPNREVTFQKTKILSESYFYVMLTYQQQSYRPGAIL